MIILITGCAGFIGYSLSEHLLNYNHKVLGIDNFDDYYSVSLKKKRINKLKKFKNFSFLKIDILDQKKITNNFKKKKLI